MPYFLHLTVTILSVFHGKCNAFEVLLYLTHFFRQFIPKHYLGIVTFI